MARPGGDGASSRACGTAGAVCPGEDDPGALSNSPSATVGGPPPLTVSFTGVPDDHTAAAFTFGLEFSENVGVSYKRLRDAESWMSLVFVLPMPNPRILTCLLRCCL